MFHFLWIALAVILAGTRSYAFVPIPPAQPVQTSSRWSATGHASTMGKGLHDGLSVNIAPGFAAALVTATLGVVTPTEIADTEDAIRAAFAAWESPVIAYDVVFDGPAVRGESLGADIDLFVVPACSRSRWFPS